MILTNILLVILIIMVVAIGGVVDEIRKEIKRR